MRIRFLLFLCLCFLCNTAGAWGHKGHAAVAALAEANLTPTASAQVKELLKDDLDRDGKLSGRKTLAQIASWADEIRDIGPSDAYRGWHTRSNSVCSNTLGACKNDHCVDQNIIRYTAVLKDRQRTLRERNEALKWVVHLVGDLHQPLHSGVYKDSSKAIVTLEGEKTRLNTSFHEAWDTDLAVLALKSGPITGTLTDKTRLPKDAPTAWMKETRDISRKYAYDPLPSFTCGANLGSRFILSRAYQQQAIPVIRSQMQLAGLRLAQLLNQTLE